MEDSSRRIAELEADNEKLRAETMRLLGVEAEVFRRNEQLDAQWKIYHALSDLGRQYSGRTSPAEIATAAAHFVLYSLNIERCVVQILEGERLHAMALDGYYDDAQVSAIRALSFAPDDPMFHAPGAGEAGRQLALSKEPPERDAIGRAFEVDEYALLPLMDEARSGAIGYLIAGNTARKALHHSRITAEDPVMLALRNLVDLASAALRSARLDDALRADRVELEARVKDRTAELRALNEQIVTELLERQEVERARGALQDEIIRAQKERLEELSTPILPITEAILVIPLIGVMDTARAAQMQCAALEGASARAAKVVILDITGVMAVDTGFADALVRTSRGLALLGVRAVVTGISPGVARTLVDLGADIGSLVTRATLRSGFTYAAEHCKARG
jgi:anti-anti-sigma regulatory factor